jgi:hypothetical protein
MNKLILTAMIVVATAFFAGCSSVKTAETAAARFHRQFNDRQFAQIYAEAGDALKKEFTEQEMIDKLQGIYDELGAEKSANETSWKVANGWTFLDYSTEFEKGKRAERFIYSMDGDKAVLATYKITEN